MTRLLFQLVSFSRLRLTFNNSLITSPFFPRVISAFFIFTLLPMMQLSRKSLFLMRRMKEVKLLRSRSLSIAAASPRSSVAFRHVSPLLLKSTIRFHNSVASLCVTRAEQLLSARFWSTSQPRMSLLQEHLYRNLVQLHHLRKPRALVPLLPLPELRKI